jgi:hypothetical protein
VQRLEGLRERRNPSRAGTPLGGASAVMEADVARQPRHVALPTMHIEFENARNQDDGLRPIAILKHRKPERRDAIDEKSAAQTALVLNDPVSTAVLAHQEE